MYIAFEGIDGSGKSTQLQLFAEWLSKCGISFKTFRQPNDSPLGKTLRHYLTLPDQDPHFLALMFAANRIEIRDEMNGSKANLKLTDRSLYSNLVYSDLGEGWFYEVEDFCNQPDQVYLFDLDPEIAYERSDKTDAYENVERLTKSRAGYLKLAKKMPDKFIVIDANRPIEKVATAVQDIFLVRKEL